MSIYRREVVFMEPAIALVRKQKAVLAILSNGYDRAALILADYLFRVTGAEFTVHTLNSPRPCISFIKVDHGVDGFSYHMQNGDIVIEATTAQAAVYAVYDFLERIVGCKYYTSRVEYIPFDANLELRFEAYEFAPPVHYRELYYRDYSDPVFAEKHKLVPASFSGTGKEQHQGWGFWCHSFETLCSPLEYFETHPEYFSLINGERVKEHSQLCLSNKDVLEIVCKNLESHIKKNPEALYWSVSQNDNAAYCCCDACRELDEKDNGPMGSLLTFVNEVAKRFPDKKISTLAYWYSRKPPAVTRPLDNVHIMLCNIEANRALPIELDPLCEDSREELLAWRNICDHVFLWDYNVQFRNLVSPFPDLYTLAPNQRFFVENHVTELFSQCNRDIGGEWSGLRGYLLAKLIWDPSLEDKAVITEFMEGYYKQAAPFLLKYIEDIHAANTTGKLSIFGNPEDGRETYLSEVNMGRYQEQFNKGLEAVALDPEVSERVRVARLPLLYAYLFLEYGTRVERLDKLAEFAAVANRAGLEKVEEWVITVGDFITAVAAKNVAQVV